MSFEVETEGAEEGGHFDGCWEGEFPSGGCAGPVMLW